MHEQYSYLRGYLYGLKGMIASKPDGILEWHQGWRDGHSDYQELLKLHYRELDKAIAWVEKELKEEPRG
jgi:hypothetical protein